MVQGINPIDLKIAQLLGNQEDLQVAQVAPGTPAKSNDLTVSNNPFEDILSKAVDALSDVSKTEAHANQLIDQYTKGQADLQDVMVASSKASVMITMAVTTINLAVTTFKEITQIQV